MIMDKKKPGRPPKSDAAVTVEEDGYKLIVNKLAALTQCPEGVSLVEHIRGMLEEKIPLDLLRSILGKIDLEFIKRLDELSVSERAQWASQASIIYKSPVFRELIRDFQKRQLNHIAFEIQGGRFGELQSFIARGTINGLDLLEDQIRMLHEEYLENIKHSQEEQKSYQPEGGDDIINKLI